MEAEAGRLRKMLAHAQGGRTQSLHPAAVSALSETIAQKVIDGLHAELQQGLSLLAAAAAHKNVPKGAVVRAAGGSALSALRVQRDRNQSEEMFLWHRREA